MKILRNENGLSLIEMIIVVALMIIAMGIVGFSVNNVNYANLESASENFQSDLRLTRNRSMYSKDKNYLIQWKYDSGTGRLSYEVSYSDGVNTVQVNKVNLHRDISVTKNGIDIVGMYLTNPNDLKIQFDKADGAVNPALGAGEYVFTSTVLSDSRKVTLVELTGRVYLDE